MASSVRGVWAIDIGTCSLKAIRVRQGEEGLEVTDFGFVEHSRILSGTDINAQEKSDIIAATLRQFLSQHDLGKDPVAISIAGQNSFSRFIKLPPVEPKKIPEIVQFEAIQQIPFDINEVEWDWQKMEIPNSPDAEVGIFAIKNELIAEIMDHFTRENLNVTCVQISPMAMYNYLLFDREDVGSTGQKATVVLDMGAENSTLVVCTKDSVWQRSIRIGGNTFTQAIAEAFKLDFEKAEKLKRTAPMSKYMRQIYTAMKPVYTELSGELQRSLGFYSSSGAGRDKGFSQIIAVGGGMKLQGLTKYLQQATGLPVVKPESFEKLKPSPEVSAAKLHENICDFGIVYGLGVQLLGQAKIGVNMLPSKIARTMAWNRKAKTFTVAAAVLTFICLLALGRAYRDLTQYNANASIRSDVSTVLNRAQTAISKVQQVESEQNPLAERAQKHFDLFKNRDILPLFNQQLIECLPNKNNTPEMASVFDAYQQGNPELLKDTPRGDRKQVFITRVIIEYAKDLNVAQFPQPGKTLTTGGGRARPAGGGMIPGMGMPGMPGMGMPGMGMPGMPGMGMPGDYGQPAEGGEVVGTGEAQKGFTVLIEGYSPYQKITELLDPPGVANDPSRWGIISRFENLAKVSNDKDKEKIKSPLFELFDKKNTAHFRVEWGVVESGATKSEYDSKAAANQPIGIGVLKEVSRVPVSESDTAASRSGAYGMVGGPRGGTEADRITRENVLVDPMTGEEISKVYEIYTAEEVAQNPNLTSKDIGKIKYDSFGKPKVIDRDSWFRIQAKFVWKEPVPEETQAAAEVPGT